MNCIMFHQGGTPRPLDFITHWVRRDFLECRTTFRMRTFSEDCFLRSGSFATAFSATFDSDLSRFETSAGFLAYATVPALATSVAFFDPVLACPDDGLLTP